MLRKLFIALVGALLGASFVTTPRAGAVAPTPPSPLTVHTGTSAADAAPSCWAIKQSFPSSASGVYWLLTPRLVTPQQFYCDMTTDGGGYVLVGRGRQGWTFNWRGQGSAATVRNTITGSSAFAPAALPATTIDGLLDGGRVDALADGVRLRRAKDPYGVSWQEVRLTYRSFAGWSWALPGGIPLSAITFDGATTALGSYTRCSTNTTCDVSLDNGYRRIFTFAWSSHNKQQGFSYGSGINGANNSTSYLWVYSNEHNAIPFTQVWIRPMLGDADVDFPVIPDTGTASQAVRALPQSTPQVMQWGVTDVLKPADDPDTKNDSPVLALAQVGNTMFVGGKFQNVQNGAGGPKTSQPWLAAFDVQTGAWINTFRPVLDGAVWDLAAAPDGTLFVGGNFSNVNGVANTAGLAKLDPATGQPVPGWKASLSGPRFYGSRAHARALDVRGPWLYVGGSFNTITGGPNGTSRNTGGAARVSLVDGTPDTTWRAFFDNAVMDITANAAGTRVYVVGFFKNTGTTGALGTPRDAVAILDTTTGAALPGMNQLVASTTNATRHWQQAILEYQGATFVGGSEHVFQKYTLNDFTLLRSYIASQGGDFQAITEANGVVYASCHCFNSSYADSYSWPVTSSYGRVENIQWVAAFDATTMERLPEFDPQWGMATTGEGPWELYFDSYGCLWGGGDVTRGGYTGSTPNWLGGFARFCPRDTTAPTTPTNFRTTVSNGVTSLQWAASTDNNGTSGMTYEILKNDRVIATQASRTYALPDTSYGRYFVRATDATGNRSASTAVLTIGAPPTYPQLVAATPQVRGYWRLGEASTAQPAADQIGTATGSYGGNVTPGAPAVITNDADTAAAFDGTSGVVSVPDASSVSPTTGVSAEAWADVADVSAGRREIVAKAGSFDLRVNGAGEGGGLVFSVTTPGGTVTATGTSALAAGRHYLVGTYNGGSVAVYDDGLLMASAPASGAVIDSSAPLTFGNGANGGLAGRLDEVALYGRALTLKEIDAHYATGGRNIIPNQPPTAAFQETCGALSCGLDAGSSSDGDGTIVSYDWSFNDGTTASGALVTHTFPAAGTYSATLTVTDDDGASDTTTQTVVVAPSPPGLLAEDAFERTVSSGWGTADTGGNWTTSGTASNFAVGGSAATMLMPSAGASNAVRLLDVLETDMDIQTRFRYDQAQTGGTWLNVVGRYAGTGLEYRGRVRIGATSVYAAAYRVASGSTTPIAAEATVAGLAPATNTWYRVRMNIRGTNPTRIKLKVWLDGSAEPAGWTVDVTDATAALQVPGSPGLQAYSSSSNAYPLTFGVDDFTVGPANASPVAAFTSNCNLPLACSVNGSTSTDSDGTVAGYTWSFGDGTVATGATATHTYAAPGTYTITLTVTDDLGFVGVASQTVVVQTPPTAAFTSSCTDYVCSFDASGSSDPDGTIASYAWSFGDGQVGSGPAPSVTYGAPGSYTVTLTVTDNQGGTGTDSQSLLADRAPSAAFTPTCTTSACSFDASASSDPDGTIASYAWDFGDGTTGTGVSPSHGYPDGGNFTVALTVTDDLGRTATTSQLVVLPARPVATFSVSCNVYDCSFDASASTDADGTITSYAWDFGDGTTGSGATAAHSYASPGSYTATLTVTDNSSLSDTDTRTVVADAAPVPQLSVSCTLLDCSFDASASTDADGTITSYTWDFGDGTTATGATATHTYALAGNWPVRVTVTDDLGIAAAATDRAIVAPAPAVDQYALDSFTRSVTNGWGSADQGGAWSVSGTPSSFNVSGGAATFTLPGAGGNAAARLTATSQADVDVQTRVAYNVAQAGNGSWVNVVGRYVAANTEYRARVRFSATSVYAAAYRLPGGAAQLVGSEVAIAGLTAAPNTYYRVRLNISGTNPTTIRIKVWLDGATEPVAWNVTVTDSTPELQVAGATGLTAYAQSSSSYPLVFSLDDFSVRPADLPPVAAFTPTCAGALTCTVDASGSSDDVGIVSYEWVFGDGTTATGANASHTYAGAGTYDVTLTLTDTKGVRTVLNQTVTVT